MKTRKRGLSVREAAIFAMLGAVMYLSKLFLQWAPNIHLLGMFIVAFTLVYRKKALAPIYVYVLLEGALSGFAPWWFAYLYVWTVLWAAVMPLPKRLNSTPWALVYCAVNALHGLLFGVLYAPAQALLFGMGFKATLAWIAAGLPFDLMHAAGNLASGVLIVPLVKLLSKLEK